MPKSRQTETPKRLTSTRIDVGGGRYLRNIWMLEKLVTQLALMEEDWEKNSAARRQWSDPFRPPYVEEVGHEDDLMIDMTVAASAEGLVLPQFAENISSSDDDAAMTPERVERVLESLARAGVIAWEPGATSIKLRPRKVLARYVYLRMHDSRKTNRNDKLS